MKVLVVEDNYIIGVHMRDRLEILGCEVLGPYGDALGARLLLERAEVDAAILDFQIRGGTSIPVAELLWDKGLPFCFVSGYRVLDGLPDYMSSIQRFRKPVQDVDLREALDSFRLVQEAH